MKKAIVVDHLSKDFVVNEKVTGKGLINLLFKKNKRVVNAVKD